MRRRTAVFEAGRTIQTSAPPPGAVSTRGLAAVRPRDQRDDREPEPGAAAAARLVGPAEAVERPLDEARRKTRAARRSRAARPCRRSCAREHDLARRRARGRCRRGSRAPARAGSASTSTAASGRRRRDRPAVLAAAELEPRRDVSSSCRAATCSSRIGSGPSSERAMSRRSSARRVSRSVSSAADRSAASSSSRERGCRSAISSSVLQEGERRPQLVARVVDEAPLVLETPPASRASMSFSVSRARRARPARRHRQALPGVEALMRPPAGASPRPAAARRPRGVAAEDREQQRRRATEHELAHEPVQRLLARARASCRDDDRAAAAVDLGRAARSRQSFASPAIGALRRRCLPRGRGSAAARRGADGASAGVESTTIPPASTSCAIAGPLGVVAIDRAAAVSMPRRSPPAPARGGSGRSTSPGARADALVDDDAHRGEHERHPEANGKREPETDRDPAQPPSPSAGGSRRRGSSRSSRGRNGRSIFSRR